MNTHSSDPRHPSQPAEIGLTVILAAMLTFLAWPPLLLGAILRLVLKRQGFPVLWWVLMGVVGLGGIWFIVALTGYVHALQAMTLAIQSAPQIKWSWAGAFSFVLHYLIPLWLESLPALPLCAATLELLLPKSLEERLLAQDQREQVAHERATRRARQTLQQIPMQIKGQAVIGVVIRSTK